MAVASHSSLWDEFVVLLSLDLEGAFCKFLQSLSKATFI